MAARESCILDEGKVYSMQPAAMQDARIAMQDARIPSYATLRSRNRRLVEESLVESPLAKREVTVPDAAPTASWIQRLRHMSKVSEEDRFTFLPLNPNTIQMHRDVPFTGGHSLEGTRLDTLQSQGWDSAADLVAQALDPCRNMDEQRPFLLSRTVQFTPSNGKSLLLPGATRDLSTWTQKQGTTAGDCEGLDATLRSLRFLPAVPDPQDRNREPFPHTDWTTKQGWESERYGDLLRTTAMDVHAHMTGLTRSRFLTGVLPRVYHRRQMKAMREPDRESVLPVLFEDDGRGATTRQTLHRLQDYRRRAYRRSLDLLSDRNPPGPPPPKPKPPSLAGVYGAARDRMPRLLQRLSGMEVRPPAAGASVGVGGSQRRAGAAGGQHAGGREGEGGKSGEGAGEAGGVAGVLRRGSSGDTSGVVNEALLGRLFSPPLPEGQERAWQQGERSGDPADDDEEGGPVVVNAVLQGRLFSATPARRRAAEEAKVQRVLVEVVDDLVVAISAESARALQAAARRAVCQYLLSESLRVRAELMARRRGADAAARRGAEAASGEGAPFKDAEEFEQAKVETRGLAVECEMLMELGRMREEGPGSFRFVLENVKRGTGISEEGVRLYGSVVEGLRRVLARGQQWVERVGERGAAAAVAAVQGEKTVWEQFALQELLEVLLLKASARGDGRTRGEGPPDSHSRGGPDEGSRPWTVDTSSRPFTQWGLPEPPRRSGSARSLGSARSGGSGGSSGRNMSLVEAMEEALVLEVDRLRSEHGSPGSGRSSRGSLASDADSTPGSRPATAGRLKRALVALIEEEDSEEGDRRSRGAASGLQVEVEVELEVDRIRSDRGTPASGRSSRGSWLSDIESPGPYSRAPSRPDTAKTVGAGLSALDEEEEEKDGHGSSPEASREELGRADMEVELEVDRLRSERDSSGSGRSSGGSWLSEVESPGPHSRGQSRPGTARLESGLGAVHEEDEEEGVVNEALLGRLHSPKAGQPSELQVEVDRLRSEQGSAGSKSRNSSMSDFDDPSDGSQAVSRGASRPSTAGRLKAAGESARGALAGAEEERGGAGAAVVNEALLGRLYSPKAGQQAEVVEGRGRDRLGSGSTSYASTTSDSDDSSSDGSKPRSRGSSRPSTAKGLKVSLDSALGALEEEEEADAREPGGGGGGAAQAEAAAGEEGGGWAFENEALLGRLFSPKAAQGHREGAGAGEAELRLPAHAPPPRGRPTRPGGIRSMLSTLSERRRHLQEQRKLRVSFAPARSSGEGDSAPPAVEPERATCANCGEEFDLNANDDSACKCVHGEGIAQVHIGGHLWHASTEVANKARMRRRWSCCRVEIRGTYADLCQVGHRAHVPLPPQPTEPPAPEPPESEDNKLDDASEVSALRPLHRDGEARDAELGAGESLGQGGA